jgi:hypothetical protein
VTLEGKKDTESWIKTKGVKYAYAYDKSGRMFNKLGVEGFPHSFLVDARGKIVWEGHPGALTEQIINSALGGALPKPLFDYPPSAGPVKSALVKHNYAAALSEAAKLSDADSGPELKRVIEGLVASRVESMNTALKNGDLLTAQELATMLKKDLDGLPQAPEPDKVLAEIKSNKDANRILAAQKKIQAWKEQRMTKKKDVDSAIAELEKIAKDLPGTYAAKEASDFAGELSKRKSAH